MVKSQNIRHYELLDFRCKKELAKENGFEIIFLPDQSLNLNLKINHIFIQSKLTV